MNTSGLRTPRPPSLRWVRHQFPATSRTAARLPAARIAIPS